MGIVSDDSSEFAPFIFKNIQEVIKRSYFGDKHKYFICEAKDGSVSEDQNVVTKSPDQHVLKLTLHNNN